MDNLSSAVFLCPASTRSPTAMSSAPSAPPRCRAPLWEWADGCAPPASSTWWLSSRLGQRLSLTYGFDFRTDRGEIELWKVPAKAVGAKVNWEGSETDLMRRLPAVVTGTGTFSNPLLLQAFQSVVVRVATWLGSMRLAGCPSSVVGPA